MQTTVLHMFCISASIWVDGKICFKWRELWFLFSQHSLSSSFLDAASEHPLSTLTHRSQSANFTFWFSRKDCSSLLAFVAFPPSRTCWQVPPFRWVLLTVQHTVAFLLLFWIQVGKGSVETAALCCLERGFTSKERFLFFFAFEAAEMHKKGAIVRRCK